MKKQVLLFTALLLVGCGNVVSTSTQNPSTSSSVSSNIENTTSETLGNPILDFSFVGYEVDAMPFFTAGWMTSGSKFGANDLKLIRRDGIIRSTALPEHNGKLAVTLSTHVTGLHLIDTSAIGKYIEFTVAGVDVDLNVISAKSYKHTVTQEDMTNQRFPDFPAYSEDYSQEKFQVNLEGNDIHKILITLNNKIIYGDNDGCNLGIHQIVVAERLSSN